MGMDATTTIDYDEAYLAQLQVDDEPTEITHDWDIAPDPWEETDPHDTMTADEWWREWRANICCPSYGAAARNLCGCGGASSEPPIDISWLLERDL